MSMQFKLSAAMGCAVFCCAASTIADEPPSYSKFIADKGPAFVTLKFVLKIQGRFGDRENESEASGIMIAPDGLILCSNSALTGSALFRRFGGGSAVPKDIKVLIGDDTEGLDADLLARDSELDLAWVKIEDPGDKKFACLDLSQAVTPPLGARVLALRRMGKYFDRAFVVSEGRLAGKVEKPRKLYVPSGSLQLGRGMPLFSLDGGIVGIVVVQMPDEEEMEGGFDLYRSGGRDMFAGLILPTSEVVKATRLARETAEDAEKTRQQDKPASQPRDSEDTG